MPQKTITVPGINCGHCVKTIETELSELENIVSVKADDKAKTVDVTWNEPQTLDKIKSLLKEINYPAQD
ncbi:MAG: copper chaperone [Calditrichales bacterium]|nr:MAG: copper chaperone [Calditrichales bacterium]